MANHDPQRCNQDPRFCLKHPILDLTLRLSLGGGGGGGKCRPIPPKASMPPASSSTAAIGGGGSTSGRRMSAKKRVREASSPVVIPQEVPPPVLTEAAIDSVQRNIAFRRAIAFIKSGRDRHPGTNEVAKDKAEGVQVELPAKLIDIPVKVDINASSSNDNLGTPSAVLHTAHINEEAKYEKMFKSDAACRNKWRCP